MEQLGSKEAALRFVWEWPAALTMGSWQDDATYLQKELGWTAADAKAFVRAPGWKRSRRYGRLARPMSQMLLQLCQEVLGLSPDAVLRRHAELLQRCPEMVVVQLAFAVHCKLEGRLQRLSEAQAISLLVDQGEWEAHLMKWGCKSNWPFYFLALRADPEWEMLYLAEADYGSLEEALPRAQKELERAAASMRSAAGTGAGKPWSPWFKVEVAGKKVCCTGKAPGITRSKLKQQLKDAGATVSAPQPSACWAAYCK